jgi:hypothetical protein
MRDVRLSTFNLGILTSHPEQMLAGLADLLRLTAPQETAPRALDLLVCSRGSATYKFWIFAKEKLSDDNKVLGVYLGHCSDVYDLDWTEQGKSQTSLLEAGIPALALLL